MKRLLIVLCGFAVLNFISCVKTEAPVFNDPIRDEAALVQIVMRINQEGVETLMSPDGLVMVRDEKTARRMRVILFREDLMPPGFDPWQIFDRDRWTITDFERNTNPQ